MIGIGAPAHDLAAANGEHQTIRRHLGDDPAAPSPLTLVADQRHDLVTRVLDILYLELDITPSLQPLLLVGSYSFVAPVDATEIVNQGRMIRRVPLDLRVVEHEHRLVLTLGEQVQQSPYKLHVLLRHRPRSIARQESA